MGVRLVVSICLLASLQLLSGCDGGDDAEETKTDARLLERADRPAPVPRRWTVETNRSEGFTIGVPPGWKAKSSATRTTIRGPRGAVVISITADRTDEALELPLTEYAAEVAEGLGARGYRNLRIGTAAQRKGFYEGAEATATGVHAASGTRQRFEVIILRRPELAVYPILIASARATPLGPARPIINRVVNSLRGRPMEPAG